MYDIGIDVGGTNIAAGIVDENMRIVARKGVKTDRTADTKQLVEAMAALAEALPLESGISPEEVESVGVGVPGTANLDTGCMEYANNLPGCSGDLCGALQEKLGRSVWFDNDANAAAWGEYLACRAAGRGLPESFLMVTLGTGVGGGIILDGKIWRGVNFAAGELGHMTICRDGAACSCGRRGCLEAYACAGALIGQARRRMEQQRRRKERESLMWKLCGGDASRLGGRMVCEAVRAGDQTAQAVMQEYVGYLGEGLVNLINIFQPAVICIGGGVGNSPDVLLPPLREYVKDRVYSRDSEKNTLLQPAVLGNDAGIIGAALLRLAEKEEVPREV